MLISGIKRIVKKHSGRSDEARSAKTPKPQEDVRDNTPPPHLPQAARSPVNGLTHASTSVAANKQVVRDVPPMGPATVDVAKLVARCGGPEDFLALFKKDDFREAMRLEHALELRKRPDLANSPLFWHALHEHAPQLQALDLRRCDISTAGLSAIRLFTKLQSLDLSQNPIDKAGLEIILKAPTLRHLGLRFDQLSDPLVRVICENGQLTSLNLDSTRITPAALEFLPMMGTLEHVDLTSNFSTECCLTAKAMQSLTKLPNLKNLDLGFDYLDAGAWKVLGKLTTLERLNLSQNSTGQRPLSDLRTLKNLRELDLFLNRCDDTVFAELSHFPHLQRLNLGNNRITGEWLASQTSVVLPALGHLSVSNNQVTPRGATALQSAAHFPQLQTIDLSFNQKLA